MSKHAAPAKDQPFDIVIFGATGYTGQLIAEYLVNRYGHEVPMAIAGRSKAKLEKVRESLHHSVPTLIGEASDLEAMRTIAAQARLVVSCTGPFLLHGSNMVRACAELGTDYVDVTGETYWSNQMMLAHQDRAKASGARIISFCGFDCVPSDLGVYLLQKCSIEQRGKPFERIKMRVHSLRGGPLGTSQATAMGFQERAKSNPDMIAFAKNPFAMCEGFVGVPQPLKLEPLFEKELDSWSTLFVMNAINTKIVHRTNFLLDLLYGEAFQYDEMVLTGPGEDGRDAVEESIRTANGFNPDGVTGVIQMGVGPDKAAREAGHYSISYYGIVEGQLAGQLDVSDDRDPGGGSTCKLVGESAMCLLEDEVTVGGGFWTPVAAMGDQLAKRLKKNGTIQIDAPNTLS